MRLFYFLFAKIFKDKRKNKLLFLQNKMIRKPRAAQLHCLRVSAATKRGGSVMPLAN